MFPQVNATIKDLVTHMLADARSRGDAAEIEPLLDAIANDRIEFEREPWNPLNLKSSLKELPAEMLLRTHMSDGHPISPEAPVKRINKLGLNRAFDQIIVLAAASQAVKQGQFPVSINISSRNACDPDSLLALHNLLQEHFGDRIKPQQIILELLEDDPANDVNNDALEEMRALGYRFAIDDQSHEEWDSARLENLGPHVDFVKIDRATVEAMERHLDGENHPEKKAVSDLFNRIATHTKGAVLLEGVRSAKMAMALKDAYNKVALVQGRDLPASGTFNQQCRDVLQGLLPAGKPLRLAIS